MKIKSTEIEVTALDLLTMIKGYLKESGTKDIEINELHIGETLKVSLTAKINKIFGLKTNFTIEVKPTMVQKNKIYLKICSIKPFNMAKGFILWIGSFFTKKVPVEVHYDETISIDIADILNDNPDVNLNILGLTIQNGRLKVKVENIGFKISDNGDTNKAQEERNYPMRVSKVKVELEGNDLLSIIEDFVKVDGLNIKEVVITDKIRAFGRFEPMKSDFAASLKLSKGPNGNIYVQVFDIELDMMKDFGIVNGDLRTEIDSAVLLKKLDKIDFDIVDLSVSNNLLTIELASIKMPIK